MMDTNQTPEFKTYEEVPEAWLDRCSGNGYERYIDDNGDRRYKDNDVPVGDMPFRPCARCGHYPNEDGDDHCIQGLGKVVNACCGHGNKDGYVMFDDGRVLRGRFKVERIGGEERARELPWTGVLDASGNRIRVGDRVELFGIVGEAVFECGAYGIAFEDVIDWDAITGKIKERTGCDNRPDFCFNDNFISFWELLWNFNCDDDCCSVVERA